MLFSRASPIPRQSSLRANMVPNTLPCQSLLACRIIFVKAKLVVESGSVVVSPDVGVADIFTSRTLIDVFLQARDYLFARRIGGGNRVAALPDEGFTHTSFTWF